MWMWFNFSYQFGNLNLNYHLLLGVIYLRDNHEVYKEMYKEMIYDLGLAVGMYYNKPLSRISSTRNS